MSDALGFIGGDSEIAIGMVRTAQIFSYFGIGITGMVAGIKYISRVYRKMTK
jgi:hypothetical protein